MSNILYFFLASLAVFFNAGAHAQSNPVWTSFNTTGQTSSIVRAPQWNAAFAGKVDTSHGASTYQTLTNPSLSLGTAVGTDISASVATSSGTTASRSLAARLADIPNVLDASASNTGASDTTAIFATYKSSTAYVLVPAGTYAITDTSILTSTTHYMGSGFWSINDHLIPIGDYIASSLTLYVPQDFAEPNIALGYLQRRRLADGVTVTIKIADGSYSGWGAISPTHPQGSQIQIIGDQGAVGAVTVQTDSRQNGYFFHINQGHAFGLLDGISVVGINGWQSYAKWNGSVTPYGAAVLADNASTVNIGSTFRSDKMYYGIRADKGSSITVAAGVVVSNCGDVAYHAFNGGHIDATGTTAQSCGDTDAGLGSGYMAEFGGTVKCETCTSTGHKLSGYAAISNGTIWAISGKASGNFLAGFLAANGGHMIALTVPSEGTSTATGNGYGYRAEKGGTMEAGSALATSNTLDGFSANAGTIDATNATSSNNGGAGMSAKNRSVIYGPVTASGNTTTTNVVDSSSIINATSN